MRIYIRLKDKKLSFSKVTLVSLKAKNNKIKSGSSLRKRLMKFPLNKNIYYSPCFGSEVITFTKYN